jgi:hypothetical protein
MRASRVRPPRLVLACVVVAIALIATAAGPARGATLGGIPAASGPVLWGAPLGVDLDPLNEVTCPATTLCVAVDRAGGVVWSTDPLGASPRWHRDDVDLANDLTAISCPSAALCVATDAVGDVVTSTDPTGGDGAWAVASIDKNATATNSDNAGGVLLRGVSCPTTTLCVAVDAVGDAFVSSDPTGGTSAWTSAQIDTGRTSGCSTAGLACQPPLVGIDCPTATLCAAVDFSANLLTTTDPASATWQQTPTAPSGSLFGVSCPTASFCAAVDGAGQKVITFDPATPQTRVTHAVPDEVDGIWCASESLCLASAQTGSGVSGLLGSTDPTAVSARWTLSPIGGVDAVACPAAELCIAVDDEGNIATGVTASAVIATVRSQLLPLRHPTRQVLAQRGFETLHVTTPIAAQVALQWNGRPSATAPSRLLAAASRTFTGAGSASLQLRLTAAGRRALRSPAAVAVTATATYATSTGAVTQRRRITFARRARPQR